jgi:hypothetical protein
MDFDNIVVYKGTDYHSSFPHIVRLKGGDLVVVFRQARVRPGTGDAGIRNERVTHNHIDPDSRIALVRATDDGLTREPDSTWSSTPPTGRRTSTWRWYPNSPRASLSSTTIAGTCINQRSKSRPWSPADWCTAAPGSAISAGLSSTASTSIALATRAAPGTGREPST